MCCKEKCESNVKIVNNFNINIIEIFSGITLLIIVFYLFSNREDKKFIN